MMAPLLMTGALLAAEPQMVRRGDLAITVTPLSLPFAADALESELARAATEKAQDDAAAYAELLRARGADSLRALAEREGYFGSPAHLTWSEAASARTGGLVPADWWRAVDPFGGTAGNGPKILPGGRWPGALARVAMAHDTDWTLGRYFGVGPLAALRAQAYDPQRMGLVGLRDFWRGPYAEAPSYLRLRRVGWRVRRVRGEKQ